MAKRIVGNTKIELTNVRTGKKEVIEKHNMLTGHLEKILSTNPWGVVNPDSMMPLVGRIIGGIALFPETKEENIENDILFNDFTAYSQCNANGTTDTNRGSLNFTESGPIHSEGKDGYKLVWDFTTSQGNGTYNCVALTHPYIDKDRTKFHPTTNFGSGYGYRQYTISNTTDTDAFNLLSQPQLFDEETGYFYRFVYVSSNKVKVHRGRRPLSKVLLGETSTYGTSSALQGLPPSIVDGISSPVQSYENRDITLSKVTLSGSYINTVSLKKESGTPYAYLFTVPVSASASISLVKINLDTFEVEEEKTLTYSGAQFKAANGATTIYSDAFPLIGDYIYLPKKDASANTAREAIYKANITNTSDITTISIPAEIQNSDGKDVFAGQFNGYVMKNKYGFWFIKKRPYSTTQMCNIGICNDEIIMLGSYSMYSYFSTSTIGNPVHNVKNTWMANLYAQNTSSVSFAPELNNYYLLSINNLSAPVTKSSEQLMKITYTLMEVDD